MEKSEFSRNVILCNGQFPSHHIPLSILSAAHTRICCDGAVNTLYKKKLQPRVVIGDLDSIEPEIKDAFADILVHNSDENTNDQTKAIQWAVSQGIKDVVILGATGKREDHTLGNISLLVAYAKMLSVCMVTDYGIFTPISSTTVFQSFVGQQVSIFSLSQNKEISSEQLKYPLSHKTLQSWWEGTLNESLAQSFRIVCNNAEVLVFQKFT